MRKIRNDEIEKTARIMAKCFVDYPLYNVFFKDDEKKIKKVFYFFWFRMYTRKNYSYITDDEDVVISYKKPEDKDISAIGLLFNLKFLFGFLLTVPLSSLKLVSEFGAMEEEYQKIYYNPHTDCYAQAICVLKESRGNGEIFKALKELDDGRPIFCETHTEANRDLYKLIGVKECATGNWHGVNHYVMKKRGQYLEYIK